MTGRFDISETIRFFTGKVNAIGDRVLGGDIAVKVDIFDEEVQAAGEVRGRVVIQTKNRLELTHLLLTLSGQIQQDDKWVDYSRSAEVAHGTVLVEGHEFVAPVVLKIPRDAVLTRNGGHWSLYARAFIDLHKDASDEVEFTVTHEA